MDYTRLNQLLVGYLYDKTFGEYIAMELDVELPLIKDTLRDFEKEYNEGKTLEEFDAVFDKYMQIFTYDGPAENVSVSRCGGGEDLVSWTYNGKRYHHQGYFFIDDDSILHDSFIAPNGKEIEIVVPYE